jgi:hypothetical protein
LGFDELDDAREVARRRFLIEGATTRPRCSKKAECRRSLNAVATERGQPEKAGDERIEAYNGFPIGDERSEPRPLPHEAFYFDGCCAL